MKLYKFFIVLVCVIALFASPRTAMADEGWVINAFGSDIAIQTDGSVMVTETIAVDFLGLQKHGIFRDLPVVYRAIDGSDEYTQIDVTLVSRDHASEPYTVSRNTTNLQIKIGDANRLISGKHVYTISYRARGVLRSFADYDELYWNVTGNAWPVPITYASARVALPQSGIVQASCYVGAYGSTKQCDQSSGDGKDVATFQAGPLSSGEGMTIAVGYTKGMVPVVVLSDPHEINYFLILGSFILILLVGIASIILLWWKRGRDIGRIPFAHETIYAEYDPPGALRPGELGVLKDESADTLDVSATIVDLAVRGYMEITEIPKTWMFGTIDYTLHQLKQTDETLRPYEKKLLNSLFDQRDSVNLSELKNTFYTKLNEIKDSLYEEVTKRGFFVTNPKTMRLISTMISVAVGVVGVITIVVLSDKAGNSMVYNLSFGIGSALIILGIIAAVVSNVGMSQRTTQGRELYRQIRGYRLYLENVEQYRQQFFERENTFMAVLPYVMVFGLTDKLARAMEKIGFNPPAPTWYHGSYNAFSYVVFANSMSSFSQSLSTAIASAPHGSGSGGGGFSGGGFGGGGGGSW